MGCAYVSITALLVTNVPLCDYQVIEERVGLIVQLDLPQHQLSLMTMTKYLTRKKT